MLPAAIRYKLHFGRYKSPRFKLGATVEDEIRGKVRIVGVSDARIPWPLALNWRQRSVVVYGALARAMRLESVQATAYWWGISVEKVRLVRRALGVPMFNEGSIRLWMANAHTPTFRRMARKAWANAGTLERRAKVSAANLGRKHSASTRRKIGAAGRGRIKSPETRRKLSEAARKRGTRPPKAGRPWTAEENALARQLKCGEVAERTGRTLKAVYHQRQLLGLSKRRMITARHTPQNGRGAS